MIRRPPRSTRTDTLFPYSTLFRSLEAPYTSLADLAAVRYWFVPARHLVLDRFDTESRLPWLRAPLLIIHGSDDRVVPVSHGRRLFAIAPEPKRFALLDGERKSVVSGKSVSVRVDLGGSRIIKKTTKLDNKHI